MNTSWPDRNTVSAAAMRPTFSGRSIWPTSRRSCENTGEMDAAANGELPSLIEADYIQGVFHCHTTYSDGHNSVEEMARAAQALGLKYLGLADHSQSLTIANGLSPERV